MPFTWRGSRQGVLHSRSPNVLEEKEEKKIHRQNGDSEKAFVTVQEAVSNMSYRYAGGANHSCMSKFLPLAVPCPWCNKMHDSVVVDYFIFLDLYQDASPFCSSSPQSLACCFCIQRQKKTTRIELAGERRCLPVKSTRTGSLWGGILIQSASNTTDRKKKQGYPGYSG